MTVVTDKRMYMFALFADEAKSARSSALTFRVKFTYANEQDASTGVVSLKSRDDARLVEAALRTPVSQPPAVGPESWNLDYSYAGDERLRPVRVFDDGTFTYFKFSDVRRAPAIFTVDDERNEATINYTVRGEYVVVEDVAEQFTLRDGDDATCIFNLSFPGTEHDELSPPRRGDGRIASALPRQDVPPAAAPAGPRPALPSSVPVLDAPSSVVAAVRASAGERQR